MLLIKPDILDYYILPDECKAADTDPVLRQAMIDESLLFKEFHTQLGKIEKWDEQAEDAGRQTLELNWELRANVYGVDDGNCTATSESQNKFIDCLASKRKLMIDAIPVTD